MEDHDDLDLHSTKKVTIPKPELFVIYTGDKKNVKDVVTYAEDFLGDPDSNLDIRIKVIRDGKKGDIINQYVQFTKIFAEQVKLYGRTRKAVAETIRICKDQDILKEYLQSREEEVITIMVALYDLQNTLDKRIRFEKYAAKLEGREERREEGREEGEKRGKEEQARRTAAMLYKRGEEPSDIAEIVGYTVETVKTWLEQLPA